jgi:hypothetical protein
MICLRRGDGTPSSGGLSKNRNGLRSHKHSRIPLIPKGELAALAVGVSKKLLKRAIDMKQEIDLTV